MKLKAKVITVYGLTQLVILTSEDAPPLGRVVLLAGRNRAIDAKVGDFIELEQTEIDGRFSYKAVNNGNQ